MKQVKYSFYIVDTNREKHIEYPALLTIEYDESIDIDRLLKKKSKNVKDCISKNYCKSVYNCEIGEYSFMLLKTIEHIKMYKFQLYTNDTPFPNDDAFNYYYKYILDKKKYFGIE